MAEEWGVCLLGKLGFGIPTNWNWQGDGGLPLTASSVTAYAVPPSPEGEGFEVPRPWLFPFIPDYRIFKPHRLQRDLKRNDAAILQRIASALAEIQAILCNRAAPDAAATSPTQENRGGPGGSYFSFPRRLCARGSMTLRRAKVDTELQYSLASEDKQSRDYIQRMPSHPLTRELSRRESLWHCQFQFVAHSIIEPKSSRRYNQYRLLL